MLKRFALLLPLCLPLPASAQEEKASGFPFPKDVGGAKLEALLQPGKAAGLSSKSAPLPRKVPRFLENPDIAPALKATLPRLPLPSAKTTSPPHPAEPMALDHYTASPALPRPIQMPAGELAHWPSIRVEVIPPLPVLGLARPDRASVADPTLETSIGHALKRTTFPRVGQTPFAPVNLPDPFELKQTVELPTPPDEVAVPPLVTFPRLQNR